MILTLDIGNTNIKTALFDGMDMVKYWRISTSRTNALMWAEHGHAFAVITTDNAAQYETDALFCRPILTAKGCVDRNFLCTRAVTTLKEGNRSAVALHFLDFCRQYHGLTGEETEM